MWACAVLHVARRGGGSRIRTCVALRASDLQSDGFSRSPIPPRKALRPSGERILSLPALPRGEAVSPVRLEPEEGVEPTTCRLQIGCAAVAPLGPDACASWFLMVDGIRLNQKRRPAGRSDCRLSYTRAGQSSTPPPPRFCSCTILIANDNFLPAAPASKGCAKAPCSGHGPIVRGGAFALQPFSVISLTGYGTHARRPIRPPPPVGRGMSPSPVIPAKAGISFPSRFALTDVWGRGSCLRRNLEERGALCKHGTIAMLPGWGDGATRTLSRCYQDGTTWTAPPSPAAGASASPAGRGSVIPAPAGIQSDRAGHAVGRRRPALVMSSEAETSLGSPLPTRGEG